MKIINILSFFISLVAIAILYLHLNETVNFLTENIDTFALAIGLLIPLSLLFLGYVQLRNTKTYILWLLLGIGMLFFYFHFKDFPQLQTKRGSALKSFKSLFTFLILFQLCRLICVTVRGREYITPSIGGSSDIFEDKKTQVSDYIIFGFLFLSIVAAQEI